MKTIIKSDILKLTNSEINLVLKGLKNENLPVPKTQKEINNLLVSYDFLVELKVKDWDEKNN